MLSQKNVANVAKMSPYTAVGFVAVEEDPEGSARAVDLSLSCRLTSASLNELGLCSTTGAVRLALLCPRVVTATREDEGANADAPRPPRSSSTAGNFTIVSAALPAIEGDW